MKRRLPALILAVALVFSLVAGCGGPKLSNVKNGTFMGTSAPDERGSYGIATVTIEGGKIKAAQYVEINGSTRQPKAAPGYTYQEGLNAIASLPTALVQKGDINKVDTVAKATSTSNMFKAAVKSALANASTTAKTGMVDGTYTLQGAPDAHGYYSKGSITVTGGKVTAATYNEYDSKTNKTKAESNYAHKEAVDAINILPGKLVSALGDVNKVDAVAKATATSSTFKSFMQTLEWLAAAKDGVYDYKGAPDANGAYATGKLAISNHKIIDVQYDEIVASKSLSKTNPNSGYTYAKAIEAIKALPTSFLKAGFTGGVDSVAGATGTSTTFKTTMNQLLQQAGK